MAEAIDDLAPTDPVPFVGQNPFVLPATPPADSKPSAGMDDLAKDRAAQIGSQMERRDQQDQAFAGQIGRDRARMEQLFNAEGIQPGEFPKWDAQAQSEKYRTDPLQSFGSLASIFAMTAAAFTKAPMTNALNGAGAAMNAIREGNDREFDRAFAAWKENNDLAFKRHQLMHQQYMDADKLLETDMEQWRVARQALATRFGDEQMKLLAEHGLYKEMIELQDSRQRMMMDQEKLTSLQDENTWRRKVMETDPDLNSSDPSRIYQGFQRLFGKGGMGQAQWDTYNEILRKNLLEGKENAHEDALKRTIEAATRLGTTGEANLWNAARQLYPDDLDAQANWVKNHRGTTASTTTRPGTEAEFITKRRQELMDQGLSETEATTQAKKEWAQAGRKTGGINAEIERRTQEKVQAGKDPTTAYNEASQEVRRAQLTPTGNKLEDQRNREKAIEYSLDTLDYAEALLDKHWAISGLGGDITRTVESAENIIGVTSQTDRRQFQRYILEIQNWGNEVLSGKTLGRPLKDQEARLSGIIAGLRAGDTGASTKRAFTELRKLYEKIQKDLLDEMKGKFEPHSGPGAAKPAAPTGDWYKQVPGYQP